MASSSEMSVNLPEKSSFSQTCSLLSQYLKEGGSFGDLSLGISSNIEANGKVFNYIFVWLLRKSKRKLNSFLSSYICSSGLPSYLGEKPITLFLYLGLKS